MIESTKSSDAYWMADAASIDASSFDIEKYITITPLIHEFISSNKFIVAAPKGYGKTLLLKYKRIHNQKRYEKIESLDIPKNADIDSFENAAPFDKNFQSYLESVSAWETLWQIAIGLSLIINHSMVQKDGLDFISDFLVDFRAQQNKLSSLISLTERVTTKLKEKQPISAFLRVQANPSSIFSSLMAVPSVSNLQSSAGHARNVIHQACLTISRPMNVYLDKIDEGVREYPLTLWRHAQNGVVGAIFRLHNPNKHIKIYSSIQLEAWNSAEDELHSQYGDYVFPLTYTKEDLQDIFKTAVCAYETEKTVVSPDFFYKDPIHAFIGLEKVTNLWGLEEEEVFPYMLRHSLRRPRDLILFGRGVHDLFRDNKLSQDEFCKLVNRVPAAEIRQQYLHQMFRFSESLHNVNLQRFFSLTTKNVFKLREMIEICSRYNTEVECLAIDSPEAHIETCRKCKAANHIFCDLYRIGLLGIVKTEEIRRDKTPYQYFEIPGHVRATHLPESQYYLLHPAMDDYIKEEQANNLFSAIRGIIVGQGRKWLPRYEGFIHLHKVNELFRWNGVPVPDQIRREFEELYKEITESTSTAVATVENSRGSRIMKLQNLISSDGFFKSGKFNKEIIEILEKIRELFK